MAWWRASDDADQRPQLVALSKTTTDAVLHFGVLGRLSLYAARHMTDGWVPGAAVRDLVPPKPVVRLVVAGLLHEAGKVCPCMRGLPQPDWGEIYVHDYLRDNPARSERELSLRKQAERKDTHLRAEAYRRDGYMCRYCGVEVDTADRRSARAAQLDHVDPRVACGLSGVVTACRSCNMRKGNRSPDAADMDLLPVPRARDAPTGELGNALDGTGRDGSESGGGWWPDPPRDAFPVRTSLDPDPLHRPDSPGRQRPEHFAGLTEEM